LYAEIDYCTPNPCAPQQTCINLIGSYFCQDPFIRLTVSDTIQPAAIGKTGGVMTVFGTRFKSDVQIYVNGRAAPVVPGSVNIRADSVRFIS
jgi:hypothetical protein